MNGLLAVIEKILTCNVSIRIIISFSVLSYRNIENVIALNNVIQNKYK